MSEMNGQRKSLGSTQSLLMVVIVVGYVGLTFYNCWRWNTGISEALITGFVLFAQSTTKGFFDWLHAQPPPSGGTTAVSSVISSPAAKPITEGVSN